MENQTKNQMTCLEELHKSDCWAKFFSNGTVLRHTALSVLPTPSSARSPSLLPRSRAAATSRRRPRGSASGEREECDYELSDGSLCAILKTLDLLCWFIYVLEFKGVRLMWLYLRLSLSKRFHHNQLSDVVCKWPKKR